MKRIQWSTGMVGFPYFPLGKSKFISLSLKLRQKIVFLALMCAMTLGTTAQAAYVTYDEDLMDAIFSQEIMSNWPQEFIDEGWPAWDPSVNDVDFSIDIRFNPVVELVAPDLLNIDQGHKLWELFGNHVGGRRTVNAFYVDELSFCGESYGAVAGCATGGLNSIVIDSYYQSVAPALLAHELGHNLNMIHYYAEQGDLMYNGLYPAGHQYANFNIGPWTFMDLIAIYPWVGDPTDPNGVLQGNFEDGFFVEITPVLVTANATPVPIPAAIFLMISGLGFLGAMRRKA